MSQSQEYVRQPARRVFATEFIDGTYTFKESDDERAPVFQLIPTGSRANRVFVCGTVTEVEDIGEDGQFHRARIVDPTGTFTVYAGQYQSEAAAALQELEPPEFVAVSGRPRTYEPDDDDEDDDSGQDIYVSIRPEFVSVVDKDIRDGWVLETAQATLERIANADAGNPDVQMVEEKYDISRESYVSDVIEALESLDNVEDTAPTQEASDEGESGYDEDSSSDGDSAGGDESVESPSETDDSSAVDSDDVSESESTAVDGVEQSDADSTETVETGDQSDDEPTSDEVNSDPTEKTDGDDDSGSDTDDDGDSGQTKLA